MTKVISPELYKRFRDEVLGYTNARQRYEPGKSFRALSDAEIADKIGVTVEEATEIRCIAEIETIEISRFFEADDWKQQRSTSLD